MKRNANGIVSDSFWETYQQKYDRLYSCKKPADWFVPPPDASEDDALEWAKSKEPRYSWFGAGGIVVFCLIVAPILFTMAFYAVIAEDIIIKMSSMLAVDPCFIRFMFYLLIALVLSGFGGVLGGTIGVVVVLIVAIPIAYILAYWPPLIDLITVYRVRLQ